MYDIDMASMAPIAPTTSGAGNVDQGGDSHVPRTLVHKTADAEVLLLAVRPLGGDRYAVSGRWPDDHLLHHRGADGRRDSLVVVETMRQAGICISHRFYGVPEGHAFVLHGFEFHLDAPLRDSGEGADVVFDVEVRRVPGSSRRVRLESEAAIVVGGRVVGRAAMRWDALPPAQYALVRSRSAAAAAPFDVIDPVVEARVLSPAAVGRDRDDAVLLADTGDTASGWRLRGETGHPALFDHGSDHVPGMVLVEAFRQACLVRAAQDVSGDASGDASRDWAVDSVQASFLAFGELGQPVTIVAEPEGPGSYRLAAQQGPRTLATALVQGGTATRPDALMAGAGVAAC
ncbi:ScbA/BarX family gamma-butyrolactone biosynthesis protein [Streptomyces sp. NPDC046862]|uniref:ScbA/BarX family gamma-butyrolactone biosynthesis protein n=1 Tax=Streptomyces sp. NPDC046862 TaxID=3154603 RepID=UPI0034546E68